MASIYRFSDNLKFLLVSLTGQELKKYWMKERDCSYEELGSNKIEEEVVRKQKIVTVVSRETFVENVRVSTVNSTVVREKCFYVKGSDENKKENIPYRFSMYARGNFYVFVGGTSTSIPRSREERESLMVQLMDNLSLDVFDSFMNKHKFVEPETLYLSNKKVLNFTSSLFDKIRTQINFNFEGIEKLFPESYIDLRVEGKFIVAVTNNCPLRFQGATYNMGPFEVKIPFIFKEVELRNITQLSTKIRVHMHDFKKSGLMDKDRIVVCHLGYIFPHVQGVGPSYPLNQLGNTCCLGNYKRLLHDAMIAGDLYKVLLHMSIYLNTITTDWYKSIVEFKEFFIPKGTTNLSLSITDMECRWKHRRPIRDYRLYPPLKDFYSILYKYQQPTEDCLVPWNMDAYISKYTEDQFDQFGYDPEGYDDEGINRLGNRRVPVEVSSIQEQEQEPNTFIESLEESEYDEREFVDTWNDQTPEAGVDVEDPGADLYVQPLSSQLNGNGVSTMNGIPVSSTVSASSSSSRDVSLDPVFGRANSDNNHLFDSSDIPF